MEIECKNGERVVVITSGPRPTVIATRHFCRTVNVLAIDQELIIDTTGAGDAFCGGFLASLLPSKLSERYVQGVGNIRTDFFAPIFRFLSTPYMYKKSSISSIIATLVVNLASN